MASIITHSIAAVIFGKTLTNKVLSKRFLFYVVLFSVLPDCDVVAFLFGIPYESFWGHRGFTHSFFFAFIVGLIGSAVYLKSINLKSLQFWGWTFFFFAVTSTHTILDALTNGGLGVAFFSPLENSRYFFPFTPLEVSPIGVRGFISQRGIDILINEFSWVVLPLLVLFGLKKLIYRSKQNRQVI
jgi:inner membrane protein